MLLFYAIVNYGARNIKNETKERLGFWLPQIWMLYHFKICNQSVGLLDRHDGLVPFVPAFMG